MTIVETNSTGMWCHSDCAVTVQSEDGPLTSIDANLGNPHAKLFTPVVRSCRRASTPSNTTSIRV